MRTSSASARPLSLRLSLLGRLLNQACAARPLLLLIVLLSLAAIPLIFERTLGREILFERRLPDEASASLSALEFEFKEAAAGADPAVLARAQRSLREFGSSQAPPIAESSRRLVSAHVVVYEDWQQLVPSLLSIEPFVGEIVVADHGSVSPEVPALLLLLREHLDRKRGAGFVRLLRVDRNAHDYGEARRIATRAATLPWVAKWDGDLVAYNSAAGDPPERCFSQVARFFHEHAHGDANVDAFYFRTLNYCVDVEHSPRDPVHTFSRELFFVRIERLEWVRIGLVPDHQRITLRPGERESDPGGTLRHVGWYNGDTHPWCAVHMKSAKGAELTLLRSVRDKWWEQLAATGHTESQYPFLQFLNERSRVNRTWDEWLERERGRQAESRATSCVPIVEAARDYRGPPLVLRDWLPE